MLAKKNFIVIFYCDLREIKKMAAQLLVVVYVTTECRIVLSIRKRLKTKTGL